MVAPGATADATAAIQEREALWREYLELLAVDAALLRPMTDAEALRLVQVCGRLGIDLRFFFGDVFALSRLQARTAAAGLTVAFLDVTRQAEGAP